MTNVIEFPNVGIALNIDRIAFEILGVGIYWYGMIICTAIVLGILYAIKSATKVGLLPDIVFDAAFWGVLFGVVGARTYFVLFSERSYTFTEAVFGLRDGGLAFYGGVIGAFIGVGIVLRHKKVRLAPAADLMGAGFLLGIAIGRWGNFFNQEAFGAATAGELPWGMTGSLIRTSPEVTAAVQAGGNFDSVLVHPCFLYESLWCIVGFVFLHIYMRKVQTFDSEVFMLFVVWYGTGRAFIESLRLDSLMVGDVRVSQALAITSASIALITFIVTKIKTQKARAAGVVVRYKDTDENKALMEKHVYNTKLEREKEKARIRLQKTERELSEPY
jgi:phosphatidylglycerol:prolipoprotein diacylglycerol transferase